LARASGVVTVEVGSLIPDTHYDVYCYAEDFNNHQMTLEVTNSTATGALVRKEGRVASCFFQIG
jgi:hypothetical protein